MFRAHLAAGAYDPSGEREHDAADFAHHADRRFRRPEGGILIPGQDQEVATAYGLLDAERLLHQELAFHHRDPPVAAAVQELARLEAVAEMAEQSADEDPLGRLGQAVEAGGGRTGEDRLAHSFE